MIIDIICSIFLAFCIFGIIKATSDYKQEIKIINAIHSYLTDKNNAGYLDIAEIENTYNSIGYYKSFLYRNFDWGYENIVPSDVLEKIKPYIKE